MVFGRGPLLPQNNKFSNNGDINNHSDFKKVHDRNSERLIMSR